ncbi:MAG TPA: GWxTD domain-containing protein [Candidatus Limnocylindria bacterium]|nr:GWxTD domain-containing protein [Candidatus Limnocylindria bacterium]
MVLTLPVSKCLAADLPPLRGDHPPFFTADLVISLDAEGRPALGVSITVPYQELSWIRPPDDPDDGRLAAGAELTVVFDPGGARTLSGDVWERRVVVGSYSASRSASAVLLEKRSFTVPPGRYQLSVTVRDLNAGIESSARQRVEVPDYSKVPVGFTDLELGLADSAGAFAPVPTRVFGVDVRRLAARAALFDRRPGEWPRRYPLRYRILDDAGESVVAGDTTVTIGRSAEPVVIRPRSTELFVGHYLLELELDEGKSHWRVDRSFDVDESGPPRDREFERMLEPLSYIATSEEIAQLRALPPQDQSEAWQEFWRRRDPTPDTPRNEALVEFFRRVRHAEKQFQGFGPGWRSDMGRIYIKFGPPDQVESRPATTQTPQLEIWYYNQPYRRFVFSDREGFGRYVLVGSPGD